MSYRGYCPSVHEILLSCALTLDQHGCPPDVMLQVFARTPGLSGYIECLPQFRSGQRPKPCDLVQLASAAAAMIGALHPEAMQASMQQGPPAPKQQQQQQPHQQVQAADPGYGGAPLPDSPFHGSATQPVNGPPPGLPPPPGYPAPAGPSLHLSDMSMDRNAVPALPGPPRPPPPNTTLYSLPGPASNTMAGQGISLLASAGLALLQQAGGDAAAAAAAAAAGQLPPGAADALAYAAAAGALPLPGALAQKEPTPYKVPAFATRFVGDESSTPTQDDFKQRWALYQSQARQQHPQPPPQLPLDGQQLQAHPQEGEGQPAQQQVPGVAGAAPAEDAPAEAKDEVTAAEVVAAAAAAVPGAAPGAIALPGGLGGADLLAFMHANFAVPMPAADRESSNELLKPLTREQVYAVRVVLGLSDVCGRAICVDQELVGLLQGLGITREQLQTYSNNRALKSVRSKQGQAGGSAVKKPRL